jgi:hypothetical protein
LTLDLRLPCIRVEASAIIRPLHTWGKTTTDWFF